MRHPISPWKLLRAARQEESNSQVHNRRAILVGHKLKRYYMLTVDLDLLGRHQGFQSNIDFSCPFVVLIYLAFCSRCGVHSVPSSL